MKVQAIHDTSVQIETTVSPARAPDAPSVCRILSTGRLILGRPGGFDAVIAAARTRPQTGSMSLVRFGTNEVPAAVMGYIVRGKSIPGLSVCLAVEPALGPVGVSLAVWAATTAVATSVEKEYGRGAIVADVPAADAEIERALRAAGWAATQTVIAGYRRWVYMCRREDATGDEEKGKDGGPPASE